MFLKKNYVPNLSFYFVIQVKKESQKSDDDAVESKLTFGPKSLTDNLPLTINKLNEKRKVVLTSDSQEGFSTEDIGTTYIYIFTNELH